MRYSKYGINAMFHEPVERPAALKLVRATHLLVLHEFRRYVRIPVMTEVSLTWCRRASASRATSIEISSGGMSLKSAEDLPIGAQRRGVVCPAYAAPRLGAEHGQLAQGQVFRRPLRSPPTSAARKSKSGSTPTWRAESMWREPFCPRMLTAKAKTRFHQSHRFQTASKVPLPITITSCPKRHPRSARRRPNLPPARAASPCASASYCASSSGWALVHPPHRPHPARLRFARRRRAGNHRPASADRSRSGTPASSQQLTSAATSACAS